MVTENSLVELRSSGIRVKISWHVKATTCASSYKVCNKGCHLIGSVPKSYSNSKKHAATKTITVIKVFLPPPKKCKSQKPTRHWYDVFVHSTNAQYEAIAMMNSNSSPLRCGLVNQLALQEIRALRLYRSCHCLHQAVRHERRFTR